MTSPFSCRTVMKRQSRSGSVSVLSVRLKNSGSDDVLRERQAVQKLTWRRSKYQDLVRAHELVRFFAADLRDDLGFKAFEQVETLMQKRIALYAAAVVLHGFWRWPC